MVLADGVIGQMMEKVILPPYQPRMTEEEIIERCPWATLGKTPDRKPNVITSLALLAEEMEEINLRLQGRYREIEKNEVLFEEFSCDDAEYLIVAFGTCARVCQKTVELARNQGIKAGLLRPITLFPFPTVALKNYAEKVKGMLTVEMSAGQMVDDVRLAVNGKVPVEFYGRMGGIVPSPDEVFEAFKNKLVKN
jgi:2-oxoglutarate ferredoxin oxidoreductase subunit alpha